MRRSVTVGRLQRDDGIVVRGAGPDDVAAIAALCAQELGAREGPSVRTAFAPSFGWLGGATVAVDRGRVVSTALLLLPRLRIGQVEVAASQIEWVAVDDVLLGPNRELIATLFPKLRYDPLVFVL